MLVDVVFYLLAVCTFDETGSSGPCYDTLYENTTVIRCDVTEWGHEPYPWEWSRGTIHLGYRSTVTGDLVVNHSFHYTSGNWYVVSGENVQFFIDIDTNIISKPEFEGGCWEHTNS